MVCDCNRIILERRGVQVYIVSLFYHLPKNHRNSKKLNTVERMRMKNMSSVDFDRKIARFYRLWEGMKLVSKNRVVEFLDIDTSHLVTAIQTQV